MRLEKFNKYIDKCSNCCGNYENSIAHYIEVELKMNIDDVWNWDKNNELNINPYHTHSNSHKDIWVYCQDNDLHNYDIDNNKIGYKTKPIRFSNGNRCSYCYNHKTYWKDSLGYNYPEIAKMIAVPENNLTMEDTFDISIKSNKKYYFKCGECGKVSSIKKYVSNIMVQNFSCEYCSDGISMPNKLLRSLSNYLDLKLQYEYSPCWLEGKRMDAYDDNLKIAIEMDGNYGNHEDKTLDNWKDKKCLEHGIYVIRVDLTDNSDYTLEYIKNRVTMSHINKVYDLSLIEWNNLFKEIQNSLCVEAWRLWNDNNEVKDIMKKLNLSKNTITKYLKMGKSIGCIEYDINNQKNKGRFKPAYYYLIDLNNNKLKLSFKELLIKLNISDDSFYRNIIKNGGIISSLNFSKSKRKIINEFEGYHVEKIVK
ncbi:hypothetical protein [Peptostreptococcus porci]|uniref:hypothetical protein n=1 Tax=Peptostreptococcus porci TaxID=2652282 RepID=UPI002A81921F|nr:hypothetical protein [Peptostreptococcus porci]MDY4127685.1 hypothetical protein [Peptostreptococcus porci]